jgi:hypothetical protein
MSPHQTIRFGASDTPACPVCKATMYLTRRTPHPTYGSEFERQTFECRSCRHELERSADREGELLEDMPPTLWRPAYMILNRALKVMQGELTVESLLKETAPAQGNVR